MTLGEHLKDDIRRLHDKFHEFTMHRKVDINLSFSFYEICTIGKYEFRRFEYMKSKS
jgi:hypothetical protein